MEKYMELKDFKRIELSKFTDAKTVDYLHDDADRLLYLDSPAEKVFRDFNDHNALVVDEDASLLDVKKKMIDNHKDYIMVSDSNHKISGTIALHFIEGQMLQEKIRESGASYSDLNAAEIKQRISNVNTMPYETIKDLRIGHVINTLVNSQFHHIVVFDINKKGDKYIRGYFSLPYIRRKLSIDVNLVYQKQTLSAINHGL
jgi:signal-transduction protein with cAMP-binding, CBS, and nucleotidyltransferase domain